MTYRAVVRLITEPFTGITTDGTPIRGLFDLVPDDAPVGEMVSAVRRLLGLLDDEGRDTVLLPLAQWLSGGAHRRPGHLGGVEL